jgi:hypothetical protein
MDDSLSQDGNTVQKVGTTYSFEALSSIEHRIMLRRPSQVAPTTAASLTGHGRALKRDAVSVPSVPGRRSVVQLQSFGAPPIISSRASADSSITPCCVDQHQSLLISSSLQSSSYLRPCQDVARCSPDVWSIPAPRLCFDRPPGELLDEDLSGHTTSADEIPSSPLRSPFLVPLAVSGSRYLC